MVDTHCHLDELDEKELEKVINNMEDNIMIVSGYDYNSSKRVVELASKYKNIYGTIGIHPTEYESMNNNVLNYIDENLKNNKIVGIGEIGLDYYYDEDHKDIQKEYFLKQIKLAQKYNKPIVIHSREACKDTYDLLKENLNGLKCILHCYSYSKEMALEYKKLGIKFGIGGVLTFKNSSKLKETVEILDINDLVLETDSPYLAPEPLRGTKNEPKNIIYVAKKISEIKNIELENVLKITTDNAYTVFDLK